MHLIQWPFAAARKHGQALSLGDGFARLLEYEL
jgi:hypothetical protein